MLLSPLVLALSLAGGDHAPETAVPWFEGTYNEALRQARKEERLVFVAMLPDWSEMSGRILTETFQDPRVVELLSEHVCYRVDTEDPRGKQLVDRFHVENFPSLLFLDGRGNVEEVIQGFIPAEPLLFEVDRVHRGDQTVSDFRGRVQEHPDDLDARLALANKLQWIGDARGHEREVGFIRQMDPHGESQAGARLVMWDLMWQTVSAEQEGGHADFGEIEAFLEATPHHGVGFDGWQWVSASREQRGDGEGARRALRKAWPHVADGDRLAFANEVAWETWVHREEMGDEDRAFALELATAAVDLARAALAEEAGGCCDGEGACDACSEGGDAVDGQLVDAAEAEARKGAWLAAYLDTLACAHYMNGSADEAVTLVEECIELAPDVGEYQERLVAFSASP